MEMYISSMTKTQVQLPDELYRRAKQLAAAREVSLAELIRKGLEYILSTHARPEQPQAQWEPPKPRRLGWRGLTPAELKEEAQRSSAEEHLGRG